MQFDINRDVLLKSLNFVQGVVEKKNTLPILSNVLLNLKGNKLEIVATDLDIVFYDEITELKVVEEGNTTTSANVLFDILRKIPPGTEINFTLKSENKLSLKSKNSDFNLLCLPSSNFPTFDDKFEGEKIEIDKKRFLSLLNKTKISISNLTSKDMVSTMTSTDDGNGSIDVDKSDNGGSEASGNVEITGMISDVVLDIRTADTFYPVQDGVDADGNPTYTAVQHVGPGDASFDVAVYPNLELDSDEFPSDACVANARACHFVDTDKLKTGNANASANLNTQTNVDINASEFTNLFAQSF